MKRSQTKELSVGQQQLEPVYLQTKFPIDGFLLKCLNFAKFAEQR